MEDRRQFYRINDKVSLNYRVIKSGNTSDEVDKVQQGFNELADMQNRLLCIDARLDELSKQLADEQPLISEVINLLNQKTGLFEKILWQQGEGQEMNPARDVNLSANGVAFETETALEEGDHLRLELIIYPENHYIPVYARVVNCRKTKNKSCAFSIAVEFVAISDNDRERIIHHVLKKQAEELRLQREASTQEMDAIEERTPVS